MTKIIFFSIFLIILIFIFSKNIANNLFKSKVGKKTFYFILLSFFIISIFLIRLEKMNSPEGKYTPPYFNGKVIVPGQISND